MDEQLKPVKELDTRGFSFEKNNENGYYIGIFQNDDGDLYVNAKFFSANFGSCSKSKANRIINEGISKNEYGEWDKDQKNKIFYAKVERDVRIKGLKGSVTVLPFEPVINKIEHNYDEKAYYQSIEEYLDVPDDPNKLRFARSKSLTDAILPGDIADYREKLKAEGYNVGADDLIKIIIEQDIEMQRLDHKIRKLQKKLNDLTG